MLGAFLSGIVKTGRLTIIDAAGRAKSYGPGPPPSVTLRILDPSLNWRLPLHAPLAFGEAYMDGSLVLEEGRIEDLLDLLLRNIQRGHASPLQHFVHDLRMIWRKLEQWNGFTQSKRNVAHHYDLRDELYETFLDPYRQYSCAYFRSAEDSLEMAQEQKLRHIAAKLLLEPGQLILDIGSGWGGLGLYLARLGGGNVHGITLSTEQLASSRARAAAEGLAERVQFDLCDYRKVNGRFDRVVSVGMFEHVGIAHYRAFFDKLASLLTDDGVALLHTIGRSDGPGVTAPWIRKYIFPGGYTPALSEIVPVAEKSGFYITDVEVLRLHYAETLKAWRARFRENWSTVAALYDERFCRMWEFYLAAAEMGFRHQGLVVFQIQLAKRVDAVPLTRDYIGAWEDSHAPATVTRFPNRERGAAERGQRAS